MFDLSRLGQGPRPDLLVQDLEERAKREKEAADEAERAKNDPEFAARREASKPERKDILAMIVALAELVFPWIAGGIAIYFAAVFLLSRI